MRYVYFVEATNTGLIKIGTTENLGRRLSKMATDCPVPLTILGTSDRLDESEVHARFAACRRVGEWFSPTDELRGFIKNNTLPFTPSPSLRKRVLTLFGKYLADIATACCVNASTVWRWKQEFDRSGRIRKITGTDLVYLSRFTGVSADVIVGVADEAAEVAS
jgi:hypothetical protein